jgi:hypothetical protein
MKHRFGIGLVLMLFAFLARAQAIFPEPEIADHLFEWTIVLDIDRSWDVRADEVNFTRPIEIRQNGKVIASAEMDKKRRITFQLTDIQVSRAFVEIKADCFTSGGCRMSYLYIQWKGILPPSGKSKVHVELCEYYI